MERKNLVHALESIVSAVDNGSLIVEYSDRLATNADIADARTALRGEAGNRVKLDGGGASAALVQRARDLYQNDDCEIDDVAAISEAKDEGGTWVQAWVWVSNSNLEV